MTGSKHMESAIKKAKIATEAVISILASAKNDSWEACTKLYDAVTLSTLLYGFPVWGLAYTEEIGVV